MSDIEWTFADDDPQAELAQLHFFSIKKLQDGRAIEFRIAVREYNARNKLSMRYYAEADKQTNQKSAPFTPVGWGDTLLEALADCIRAIKRFPYEPE
jgi:hypothetical protein